jgi:hypothetical protein
VNREHYPLLAMILTYGRGPLFSRAQNATVGVGRLCREAEKADAFVESSVKAEISDKSVRTVPCTAITKVIGPPAQYRERKIRVWLC